MKMTQWNNTKMKSKEQELIPQELANSLKVGNIVEYQSIVKIRVHINSFKLEEALKVDYKNILKVWNKNGEMKWKTIKK